MTGSHNRGKRRKEMKEKEKKRGETASESLYPPFLSSLRGGGEEKGAKREGSVRTNALKALSSASGREGLK